MTEAELSPGLYEVLLTEALEARIEALDEARLRADLKPLRDADAADRLSIHVAEAVMRGIQALPEGERARKGLELTTRVLEVLRETGSLPDPTEDLLVNPASLLAAVLRRQPDGTSRELERPLTPLLDTTLLTNSPGEPAIGRELRAEIDSADEISALVAFVRWSGIQPLLDPLRRHCRDGKPLLLITTTYTNSTELRALDELATMGASIRVSYDTTMTRLHAKAWHFHRRTGHSTGYIGSSNLTHSAQVTGLEWNVRVSEVRNPDVIAKIDAVFRSYWESGDFVPFDRDEFQRRTDIPESVGVVLSPLDIELRPFQERLLEQIQVARRDGRHRNLLVAATGTGKTVMAAVDYARLRPQLGKRDRLLFVAHRGEILAQSQATFRQAVRDPTFGEMWLRGRRPSEFEHVFASIQSLSHASLEALDPTHFDVVIVDEFHHAAAPSYRRLLEHVQPGELLGLTATPERADGLDVLSYFSGRIAAELRVWDAIDQQYLVPFSYFGINDGVDLRAVPWRRGVGYDPQALTNVLTADSVWASRVISQLHQHVADVSKISALAFCVTISHARFMAEALRKAGIPAAAVWGDTPNEERQNALRALRRGEINVLCAVDLFNEGVDLPNLDTLLMLRPTDSATLFLQQLGRGLRRSPGKSVCTVLDFVGQHRREFRFDQRYRALLGGSRRDIESQVRSDFPFLPSGCHMELDAVSRDIVLRSIRDSIPSVWKGKVEELRSLGDVDLEEYLSATGLELEDMYGGNHSWAELRRAAGVSTMPDGSDDTAMLRAVGRLLHADDPERIAAYLNLVTSRDIPDLGLMTERGRRFARMLLGSITTLRTADSLSSALEHLWEHPTVLIELQAVLPLLSKRIQHLNEPLGLTDEVPLVTHARYTRTEILAAFDAGRGAKPPTWQTGVWWDPASRCDLFAFTLDKSAGSFSPTTRYRDYAINPELVHWESQSATAVSSETGQRYINQSRNGTAVVLFARLNTDDRAFWCLGPADYVSHEGDRPIAITWRLHTRLPGDLFASFAAAAA